MGAPKAFSTSVEVCQCPMRLGTWAVVGATGYKSSFDLRSSVGLEVKTWYLIFLEVVGSRRKRA